MKALKNSIKQIPYIQANTIIFNASPKNSIRRNKVRHGESRQHRRKQSGNTKRKC